MNSVYPGGYYTKDHLQAVGEFIQGILMPFNVRNKYGHWASEKTEFGLEVFPAKPLLMLHMLDGKLESHGVFDQSSLVKKEEGLWGRSLADDFARQFVIEWPSGWSLGSMSHLVEIGNRGHIDQWVFVEGSIGHVADLANWPGTTTAFVQSFFPGVDLPKTEIVRGIFVMDEENENVEENIEEPIELGSQLSEVDLENLRVKLAASGSDGRRQVILSVEDPFEMPSNEKVIQTELANINRTLTDMEMRLAKQEDAATRTLPDKPKDERPAPVHWNDSVASQYDDQSLAGMVFDDAMNRARAHADPNLPYRQTDEFMRAIIDKMRGAHEIDMVADNQPELQHITADKEKVYSVPVREISLQCYQMFHEKVPYLQADEAMRTGFTSFGAEIIPTLFNSVMYHHFRASALVWSNLTTFEAPSYPNYEWPVLTSGPVTRRAKEIEDESQLTPAQSPIPSSKIGTANVTFNALGAIAARTVVSEALVNASAAPLREAMMREFQLEMGAKIDWILLNGDETASGISHGASTENTVWDKALLMDGLRKIARTNSDDVAHATVAITSQGVIKALMGARRRFGRDVRNLITFLGPEVSDKFAALTEYQNINEVGRDLSTLLNGEIGRVNGIPHVATEQLELGDSSGDYAGTDSSEPHTGGTVGIWGIVHKPTIKVAQFQALRFNIEFIIHARSFQFTSSFESDIQAMEVGGVAFGFNTTI